MKKKALIIANVIGIILLTWIILSYLNVISHNATDCKYWAFNFFTLFFKK